MASNTISIVLGATSMELTKDPIANNNTDLIPKSAITGVSGVYNAKPATATQEEWSYPYATMTILQVEKHDGSRFNIELQKVSNQATWNTGQQAGLQAAIAAINAWL